MTIEFPNKNAPINQKIDVGVLHDQIKYILLVHRASLLLTTHDQQQQMLLQCHHY